MKMFFRDDRDCDSQYTEITVDELRTKLNGLWTGKGWGMETIEVAKIDEDGNIYYMMTEYEC